MMNTDCSQMRSNGPSPRYAPVAGVSSALHSQITGQGLEPAILRKRRIDHPKSNPLGAGDAKACREFVLLGNQKKFAVNVPYKLPGRGAVRKVTKKEEAVERGKLYPVAPETRFNPGKKSPKKKGAGASSLMKSSNNKRDRHPLRKGEGNKSVSPLKKRSVPKEGGANAEKIAVNENTNNNNAVLVSSADDRRSDAGATVMPADKGSKGKPLTETVDQLDHVVRYRAGLPSKRPHGAQYTSEYQKMFRWRKGDRPVPILAAEQIIHNNNTEMLPSSHKVSTFPSSEYQSQYRPWTAPAAPLSNDNINNSNNNNNSDVDENTTTNGLCGKSVVQRDKLVEGRSVAKAAVSAGTLPARDSSKATNERSAVTKQTSESPDSPVKWSGRQTGGCWISEYLSNYQPFTQFSYDRGAWRGARSPQMIVDDKENCRVSAAEPVEPATSVDVAASAGNWFAEVRELREKAAEYRRRARGMHFSREHVGQLPGTQAKLWDASTVTSSLSELRLDSQVPGPVNDKVLGPHAPPPQSDIDKAGTRRLAWSCDGSRSTSDSDSVRSIRSGHTEELLAAVTESNEEANNKSPSRIPAAQPVGQAANPTSSQCDCPLGVNDETNPVPPPPSPTTNKPSADSRCLRDKRTTNRALPSSPSKRRSKTGLKPHFEGAADTYNVQHHQAGQDGADAEDECGEVNLSHQSLLSASMTSLASTSSSLASELLERAEKRRTEFWGRQSKPSRK